MSFIQKKLSTFTKRSIDWTGILERIMREFVNTAEIELSETDLDNLYRLPDRLVDLVQSGILHAIELKAGRDGLRIEFPSDPDAEDELDMSMLMLCDLSGSQLQTNLVITEPEVARGLGAETLTELSSERLSVSLRGAENDKPASEPVETETYEQNTQNNEDF